MTHAKAPDGKPVPLPEDFYIDMDVCMNCGLCAEYCPFDAIKMDQNFELSNYERHQTHIYSMQDLLVSSEYYAKTHPEAWSSSDEVVERGKVAKKKDQRLQKALAALEDTSHRPSPRPIPVQSLNRPSRRRRPLALSHAANPGSLRIISRGEGSVPGRHCTWTYDQIVLDRRHRDDQPRVNSDHREKKPISRSLL